MLDSKGMKVSEMERVGNGGKILILENGEKKYILKAEQWGQSINEYVAQNLLKALGFADVPVELIMYNGKCYGATEYQDGIKRIFPKSVSDETEEVKYTILELYFLNVILGNCDEGEYYLKDGKVISLDYGESIISSYQVGTDFAYYDINISEAIKKVKSVMTGYFENEDFKKALKRLKERFAKLDFDVIADCCAELEVEIFEGLSTDHYNYIIVLRNKMEKLRI